MNRSNNMVVKIWLLLTLGYGIMIAGQKVLAAPPVNWDDLIGRYFLSQDITYEVNGKRLFLSDGEIHEAAGYLYLNGFDPSVINFQHPPLIKYLYGYAYRALINPLWIQVVLGYILLLLTFYVGYRVYHSYLVPSLAAILLLVDPLFRSLTTEALLDLGQAVLILTYFISLLVWKKNFWLSGMVLGLLIGSKFWGSSLFFIIIFLIYLILTKQINWKKYSIHLIAALITLGLVYWPTFVVRQGKFNLIWFQLKLLKYWLNHSVATAWGAALRLFLTGQLTSWWGDKKIVQESSWSIIWPICLIANLVGIWMKKNWRRPTLGHLILSMPVLYLVYLSIQAPFVRYYILILPFLYLGIADFMVSYINKAGREKVIRSTKIELQ